MSAPVTQRFKVVPAHYVATPFGGRTYRRFPGQRPQSQCTDYLSKKACQRHSAECRWISDITGANYCRGLPGAVSARVPAGASEVVASRRGLTACEGLSRPQCRERSDQCSWIEDRTGKQYCRGFPGAAIPLSTRILAPEMAEAVAQYRKQHHSGSTASAEPHRSERSLDGSYSYDPPNVGGAHPHRRVKANANAARGKCAGHIGGPAFSGSGRFYPAMYTEEEKDSWYPTRQMPVEVKKYLRCILYQFARDWFTYGHWRTNPYAVCNFTVAGARARNLSGAQLRSLNALASRYGMGTRFLDFDCLPTELVYAYLAYHKDHGSARGFIQQWLHQHGHTFPSVQQFLHHVQHLQTAQALRQHYQWLVDLANALKQKEQKRPISPRIQQQLAWLQRHQPAVLGPLRGG